ncbi:F0F1 ATP synthase subunit epsilon [Salidesulfovibrio onnuriiensis]|uniref:F0F1 ATP synthase subunit epsilon n=1 Tax=Salidesulfovibrio onnuriiensis TaxID=2583823 RepID=UPI0011C9182F|nr:F0F1 ATP synthase subunit epsilon [Salidesulfovibrio onnuriiensis]
MRLIIALPDSIPLDREVSRVRAGGLNGSFTLLENHVDFVTLLRPGILSYEDENGEHMAAVNRGVLVKRGGEVRVSTLDAVTDRPLGSLREAVAERFTEEDEAEAKARQAVAKIEAGFLRRLVDLGAEQGE